MLYLFLCLLIKVMTLARGIGEIADDAGEKQMYQMYLMDLM